MDHKCSYSTIMEFQLSYFTFKMFEAVDPLPHAFYRWIGMAVHRQGEMGFLLELGCENFDAG